MELADCRRCLYFKTDNLTVEERQAVERTARARGEAPLGYCQLYQRGVTYYTGPCKGYKPKAEPKVKPLNKFFGGNWGW